MSHLTIRLKREGLQVFFHVYHMVDRNGNVVDVGYTTDPKSRYNDHVNRKPGSGFGIGRHYGRVDLTLKVVHTCETKEAARVLEDREKEKYDLPLTEKFLPRTGGLAVSRKLVFKEISSKGGRASSSIERVCPYCGRKIKGVVFFYHIKKCLQK